MSRREFEVDEVSMQDGFVKIRTNATTGGGALVGGAIGAAVAGPAGVLFGALLGAAAGKSEEEKMIPSVKASEITKTSSGKYRVVIDD